MENVNLIDTTKNTDLFVVITKIAIFFGDDVEYTHGCECFEKKKKKKR